MAPRPETKRRGQSAGSQAVPIELIFGLTEISILLHCPHLFALGIWRRQALAFVEAVWVTVDFGCHDGG